MFVAPDNGVLSLIYDRKGDWWKMFTIGHANNLRHEEANKKSLSIVHDAAVLVDVQAEHCTTLYFHGIVSPDVAKPQTFTVQNMRSGGR